MKPRKITEYETWITRMQKTNTKKLISENVSQFVYFRLILFEYIEVRCYVRMGCIPNVTKSIQMRDSASIWCGWSTFCSSPNCCVGRVLTTARSPKRIPRDYGLELEYYKKGISPFCWMDRDDFSAYAASVKKGRCNLILHLFIVTFKIFNANFNTCKSLDQNIINLVSLTTDLLSSIGRHWRKVRPLKLPYMSSIWLWQLPDSKICSKFSGDGMPVHRIRTQLAPPKRFWENYRHQYRWNGQLCLTS